MRFANMPWSRKFFLLLLIFQHEQLKRRTQNSMTLVISSSWYVFYNAHPLSFSLLNAKALLMTCVHIFRKASKWWSVSIYSRFIAWSLWHNQAVADVAEQCWSIVLSEPLVSTDNCWWHRSAPINASILHSPSNMWPVVIYVTVL